MQVHGKGDNVSNCFKHVQKNKHNEIKNKKFQNNIQQNPAII